MISAESKEPSSPPVYHFLAGAWAYVMFGFAATVVGPTLQPIRESFGLGLAELGLIFPFTAVSYVVSSLIGSVASDRCGRRPFVIAGTTSIAAGIAVMALAPAWSVLLMGGVIAGFGMGLLDGPLNALIVDMTPSGFLEDGEHPEDGARREVREEARIEIELKGLIGVYVGGYPGEESINTVTLAYAAVPRGEPKPGGETTAVGYFPADAIPENLAFDHSKRTIMDWRAGDFGQR